MKEFDIYNRIKRRSFLKMLGGGLFALPFLESVVPSRLALATKRSIVPKRLICICSSNGQYGPQWHPDPNLLHSGLRLESVPGDLSGVLGSSYSAIKNKLLLLRGLDFVQLKIDEHWANKGMSGFGQTDNRQPTIDQVVAQSAKIYPIEPYIRCLFLMAPNCQMGSGRLENSIYSYSRDGETTSAITPITNARTAYSKLFSSDATSDEFIADQIHSQYTALLKESSLSTDDRLRLQKHIAFLDDLERRLPVSPGQCTAANEIDYSDDEFDFVAQMKNLFDVATAAIRCDLTRVIRINMSHGAELREFSFLPGVSNMSFHGLTHDENDESLRQYKIIQKLHGDLVGEFLAKLNEIEDPETGATYLDNSLVYWTNEVGTRPVFSPRNRHDSLDMPVLIAGGCQGSLNTGRYIDYRRQGIYKKWKNAECSEGICEMGDENSTLGRPYNELLITIMTALGLEPHEWEFGAEQGFGDYSGNEMEQYDLNNRRNLLSEIIKT